MKTARGIFLCTALGLFVSAAGLDAATYRPLSDQDLASRSPIILRALVQGSAVRVENLDGKDLPFTITTLQPLETLKGSISGGAILVRLPGGRIGDQVWWLPGTPVFQKDQEVLVFLEPRAGHPGEYQLSEFGLGHFDIQTDRDGRRFAVRPAFEPAEDLYLGKLGPAPGQQVSAEHAALRRDADSLIATARGLRLPRQVAPEVILAAPSGDLPKGPLVAQPEWVNLGGPENDSNNLFKWFWPSPSPNGVVTPNGTQSNLDDDTDGTADLAKMVSQWHGIAASTVHYSSGVGGNVVVNLDVDNAGASAWTTPLACNGGGVVGLGGPDSASSAGTFKGDSPYFAPSGGTVWVRHICATVTGGVCVAPNSNCYPAGVFENVVLHEMGHTLGLGHPDQSTSIHSADCPFASCTAVMRSVLTGVQTPQADDIAAMQWYYGTVAPQTSTFTFAPPSPSPGQTVTFSDTSPGSPISWAWDFGDPSSGASDRTTTHNPTHSFASAGSYNVTLTATNADGPFFQALHAVVVVSAPVASFTFAPPSPAPGQTVTFTDTSSGAPTSWSWNFGDPSSGGANTSTLQNPTHSFATATTYSVTLTATNGNGPSAPVSHNVVVAVPPPPTASFTFSPPSPLTGQTVTFTDTSTGSPTSWAWDFGDPSSGGNNTSTLKNPTHSFASASSYTVTLTATNANGPSAPLSHQVVVSNPTPPTASFNFAPFSPVTGQTVFFTDTSSGNPAPSSWSWNFGDSTTSTLQNPSHAYATAGPFTITLTTSNSAGPSAPVTHNITVSTPGSPPVAAFTFSPGSPQPGQPVNFTDTSSGGPTSWTWTFGDSFSAFVENPSHTFSTPSTFTVTLTAHNAFGSNSVSHSVTVSNVTIPVASFTFSPPNPLPGQSVTFTDTSSGPPTGWTWDFGDSGSSNSRNPTHAYIAAGLYTVRLTALNPAGSSQATKSVSVHVATPCPTDSGTLPANAGHNFCITLSATDPRTGHVGPGLAIPQNDIFGYFSIPALTDNPSNPEVFIKVLDGRPVNGNFWVFYGGLTDLEYDLTIKDFQTGAIRTYHKAPFVALGGFDTSAFPGSPAIADPSGAAAVTFMAAPAIAGCSPDSGTLCLNSAHAFYVSLQARDQRTNNTGPGLAIPQNDIFGYFSIPALTDNPSNPEVFVKVLDGTPVNGHFWVFFGGLTDLEYTVTVREVATGHVKTYFKPAGSAAGGFDTSAF